jgi:low affinity Fe/Cu permease
VKYPWPRVPRSALGQRLERGSRLVTNWTGSSWAFAIAVLVVVVWLATGPIFHYSDTWQLVINTGTTIVTFLMVFLIQRAQNKDALAVHLKLNEIVAAINGASNRLIDVEDLSEADLVRLHLFYKRLAEMAKRDFELGRSHSVEEADARHRHKHKHAAAAPEPPEGSDG